MYSSTDIKWVKNIKRENGAQWAYMEDSELPEFDLHFSKFKKASAAVPKSGDIIVLFQRVDRIVGVEPETYITHLVCPVDDIIYPSDREDFPIARRVRVVARGNKANSPFVQPNELNFFKPNRGAIHSIDQLNESKTVEEIQNFIWNLFSDHFINDSFKKRRNNKPSLSNIYFENFKLFKNRTEFEIAPITIFTGRNSAGKSSVFKSLLLLSDFLKSDNQLELNLNGPNSMKHRLNKWGNVKNWFSSNQTVTLGYSFKKLNFELRFSSSDDAVDALLFLFKIESPSIRQSLTIERHAELVYELLVSKYFLRHFCGEDELKSESQISLEMNELEKQLSLLKQKKSTVEQTELLHLITEEQSVSKKIKILKAKLRGLNKRAIEKQTVYNISMNFTENTHYKLSHLIQNALDEAVDENDTDLHRMLLNFPKAFEDNSIVSVYHLNPGRVQQARLYYLYENNSEFHDLINWYSNNATRSGENHRFLLKWLKQLGIGEDIRVKSIEGEAATIKIKLIGSDKEVDLADLGYGAGQILTILLAIMKLGRGHLLRRLMKITTILLIEESESNLHPQLQSELAKLFHEAYKTFGIQFILETHSEYLIRKWQVMVAKDEILPDDVIIYYLEEDEKQGATARKIEIESNGKLSQEFGRGFFDEATRNSMELFQYRHKK